VLAIVGRGRELGSLAAARQDGVRPRIQSGAPGRHFNSLLGGQEPRALAVVVSWAIPLQELPI